VRLDSQEPGKQPGAGPVGADGLEALAWRQRLAKTTLRSARPCSSSTVVQVRQPIRGAA
jgi:hypothetical protein